MHSNTFLTAFTILTCSPRIFFRKWMKAAGAKDLVKISEVMSFEVRCLTTITIFLLILWSYWILPPNALSFSHLIYFLSLQLLINYLQIELLHLFRITKACQKSSTPEYFFRSHVSCDEFSWCWWISNNFCFFEIDMIEPESMPMWSVMPECDF